MTNLLKIFRAAALLAVALACPARAEEVKSETMESLTVGSRSFTNVTILNRTRSDLFIRHAGGMANVKVKELDKATQLQLGYSLADPAPTNAVARTHSPLDEIDPRYEEAMEKLIWETQEILRAQEAKIFYMAGGAVVGIYLFFCWCCGRICRKAGLETGVGLVWLPLLKQVPLLRAAGMSPWWMLTNLFAPAFCIAYIVWSFKIAKARGKGAFTGVLLLLPVLNVFAFLYLAFADRLNRDDENTGHGRMVTFQQPRRAA